METKGLLRERKSVSDVVIDLTDYIARSIIADINNSDRFISKSYRLPCYENTNLKVRLPFVTNEDYRVIRVIYTLYEVAALTHARDFFYQNNVTEECYWDDKNKRLRVTSLLCKGRLLYDFTENLIHEITHLYENSMGRKKRDDLYRKCMELYNRGKRDIMAAYVGAATYHTFPNEQDCFAHQFYAYLCRNNKGVSFEEALKGFKQKQDVDAVYNFIKKYENDNRIIRPINELGYNRRSFFKRVDFAYKRLMRKFRNAYNRFHNENMDLFMCDEARGNLINRNIRLQRFLFEEGVTREILEYGDEYDIRIYNNN